MDLDGFRDSARDRERHVKTVAIDTPEPSVFCHEILNANPYAFLDDAPLEERRARAVQLRRTTRDDVDGAGILDPAAIAEVAAESWPVVRDADELHDALTTLIVLPPVAHWQRGSTNWFPSGAPLCHPGPVEGSTLHGLCRAARSRARSLLTRLRRPARRRSPRFCAAGSSRAGPDGAARDGATLEHRRRGD